MKKLNIIIILLVIGVILLGIGILFTSGMLSQPQNMKTIALSSTCTAEVVESDTNMTLYADTINLYNDTKNGIEIISYNSQDAFGENNNALGGAVAFATIRDGLTVGENLEIINGFSLYKCNGYYSAKLADNTTHDNIVIVCKDLEMLKKIVSSVKFSNNTNDTNNTSDSKTVNTDTVKNTASSNSSNSKPAGVSDEEWQAHEQMMSYRESHPYAAEDGSRYATKAERDAYQSQLTANSG